jgi:L-fucose isomerase-like protein
MQKSVPRSLMSTGNEDWNNNYGDDPNKCVVFHCGNWAKSFFGEVKMANAEILATTLGTENIYYREMGPKVAQSVTDLTMVSVGGKQPFEK